MTREEAVKWLKTTMDNYDFFPETKEVLKLAVEALSAECPQNNTDIGTTEQTVSHEEAWAEPSEIVPDVVCVSLNNGEQYYFSREAMLQQTEREHRNIAYDTCPQNDTDIGITEQVTSKLKKPCDSLLTEDSDGSKVKKSKLEPSDLISRADAIKLIQKICGDKPCIDCTFFYDGCLAEREINKLPSVSAERQPEPSAELVTLPGSWLDDEDGTVICSECESEFYYGDDDELGDLFKQQRFCPECGHRMTDDDRWRISKKSILKRIIEQFEDHEQQAKDKPHGLKEYAVWKQAAREVEEYMKARGYER